MKCGTLCSPVGPGSITVYAPDSNGDVTPIRTISGAHTKLGAPHGIALDSNGNIYVLNATGFFGASARFDVHYGSVPSANFLSNFAGTGTHAIRGPILIFAAGSDGDVAPIGAIGGPLTALNPFAVGIAVGPAGP